MMSHPRIGQPCRLHYRAALRPIAPHHGRIGTVVAAAGGRPRNHLIRLADGTLVVVPAGHLREARP
jgi:hypothetical protein